MSQITTNDLRPARGRARQAELAAEMKRAIEINSAIMLAGLGRPYSLGERYIAEAICDLHYRAARMRDSGRSDISPLLEAARLQQGSIFAARHPGAQLLPAIDPTAA